MMTTEAKANGEGLIAVNDALAGELAGASTWWQLSGVVNAGAFFQAGLAAGIAGAHLPSETSPKTALRRACNEVSDKRTLARSLPGGGWAIVRETTTGDASELAHAVIATVKLTPSGSLEFSVCDSNGELADAIRVAYWRARGELDASDLSAWLVDTAERIGAVALRDRGGVYFIPRGAVDTWRKVAEVLRSQAQNCDVYELPTLRSAEAIRSILAAITREAEQAANDMMAKIDSGELGERALRARGADCAALADKLSAYESLLGVSLDAVKATVENVASAAQAAALVASAEESTH